MARKEVRAPIRISNYAIDTMLNFGLTASMQLHSTSFSTLRANGGPQAVPVWRDEICSTFVDLDCEEFASERFFGEVATRGCDYLQFSKVTSTKQRVVRSPSRIAKSDDDFFLLSLQLVGEGYVRQGKRVAVQAPGDMAFYETNSPYELMFNGDFRQFIVKIPRTHLKQRVALPEDITGQCLSGKDSSVRLAARYLTELANLSEGMFGNARELSNNVGLDLLATAIKSTRLSMERPELDGSRSCLLQQILYFIRDHLSDPDLSPSLIAQAHGISVRYLNMLFEDQPESLFRTIWTQRIERCAWELRDPSRRHATITDIAFAWGFNDSAHFSRRFKAAYGVKPSDYRCGRSTNWSRHFPDNQ